jgi:hypothetical protein
VSGHRAGDDQVPDPRRVRDPRVLRRVRAPIAGGYARRLATYPLLVAQRGRQLALRGGLVREAREAGDAATRDLSEADQPAARHRRATLVARDDPGVRRN